MGLSPDRWQSMKKLSSALDGLKGVKLASVSRACDMLMLSFGKEWPRIIRFGPRKGEPGTRPQYALHIQCPWRLDNSKAAITGRSDLYTYVGPGDEPANFSPDFHNCLLDQKRCELFGIPEGMAQTRENWRIDPNHFIVTTAEETTFGDLRIGLTPDYVFSVFPAGTDGEQWRFFSNCGPGGELLPEDFPGRHYVFPK
jgi:hypothetical protein